MPFSLSLQSNRIANLIINDHSIRFLELKQTNPPVTGRWGEKFLPPGIISEGKITDFETLENILEECVDEWKIHKRNVRFTVPDSLIIIRKVAIPADVEEDEIKSYLYMELGSSIHLPFEDPVFDIFPLKYKGTQKEVVLFAAPEQYVMEYSNLLSGVKLNPIAADISPLALYRLYHSVNNVKGDERVFKVHFTLTNVMMSIFENHIPQFMRHFPIELNIENWKIKRDRKGLYEYTYTGDSIKLQYQFEDIYKEMVKLMDFYRYSLNNGNQEVTKIVVSGDHPMLSAFTEEMVERSGIQVEVLQSGSVSSVKNKELPATHLLALGLALKEVE
ncbi:MULTISPECIES: type IV pilus biogenesis protein PilM [unclassified Bacillus (in: firmicutes)]|uniref:type IV pilus biogenesis protein PilM n=1 Tax=unclassified Bacillus (in: firmicutes) TaxID=185979 RepID=UPI0008EDBBC3|nr:MULTISPECIES: pilus assembly protein PilM [unclassified Bacillus (in: firmicutes)]SFB16269.1 type IV pilus assembly protein PilM [Bacillus sp. UNCCL13]SFQ78174.1 type IV pilus assembly protein PilM [Bacillus sp. cl95]